MNMTIQFCNKQLTINFSVSIMRSTFYVGMDVLYIKIVFAYGKNEISSEVSAINVILKRNT